MRTYLRVTAMVAAATVMSLWLLAEGIAMHFGGAR